jgi:hypothetical protein
VNQVRRLVQYDWLATLSREFPDLGEDEIQSAVEECLVVLPGPGNALSLHYLFALTCERFMVTLLISQS